MITNKEVIDAVQGAVSSRGKSKGMLKAKCPGSATDAAAAWQAIISFANPFKVSVGTCVLFSERQRQIFSLVELMVRNGEINYKNMDRDRVALDNMGVW